MVNKAIIKKIKEYSIHQDWYVAFDGKSKGNRHLFRVARIANFLAKQEKANIGISVSGAWLHDIGLTEGDDNDPKKIRKIAEKFLDTLDLSKSDKSRIAHCVEAHEGAVEAKSLEAKIVHDADVLDKMGVLGAIRHTWKLVHLLSPKASAAEIFDILMQHLQWRREKLYTKTAKELVKKIDMPLQHFFNNRDLAIEAIGEIMNYSKRGFTSEKIAMRMLENQRLPLSSNLRMQLYCSFLA